MPIEAWALALGSASLLGLGLVVTQFGLRDMSPALGATFSMPMVALVFWSSVPFFADFNGWDGDAVLLFVVVGIFFPGMITLLTFEANRQMGPYVTWAIGDLAPLFAVVVALVVLGEALDILQWLAVVAILGGVTNMSLRRQWEGGSGRRWVIALPLVAALC
jgi:drug/metabolite transporter (DMT)-like permease